MTPETYVIHLTKKCNMKCKYCYEQDKDSIYTEEEISDILFKISNVQNPYIIEFLGGEPTLEQNLIKRCINYLESKYNSPQKYILTTNGIISVHSLMRRYPKLIWAASMDGTSFMNSLRIDENGYNSYGKVMTNFKNMLDDPMISDDRLNIHMVTHPYNVAYLYNGIKQLYDQGVKNIGIGTIESTFKIGREYCIRFIYEMDKISEAIVKGEFENLHIDLLHSPKPRTDKRIYIKDKYDKVICESYGRDSNNFIAKQEGNYTYQFSYSELGELIEDLREIVYLRHKRCMNTLN